MTTPDLDNLMPFSAVWENTGSPTMTRKGTGSRITVPAGATTLQISSRSTGRIRVYHQVPGVDYVQVGNLAPSAGDLKTEITVVMSDVAGAEIWCTQSGALIGDTVSITVIPIPLTSE